MPQELNFESLCVSLLLDVTVDFAAEAYQVLETGGSVTVCVNKSLETALDFNVTLVPSEITATGQWK